MSKITKPEWALLDSSGFTGSVPYACYEDDGSGEITLDGKFTINDIRWILSQMEGSDLC